jgi:hypothetical protein
MAGLEKTILPARPLVRLGKVAGPQWTDGRMTVTPVARSLTIGSTPGDGGGRPGSGRGLLLRYSRPSAVIVSMDGSVYRMPIVDVTRWAQLAIVLVALLVLWEVWARTNTRKERS